MEEYVVDQYVDPEYAPGDINLKCVLSSAERAGELSVDLPNGRWIFRATNDPEQARTRDAVRAVLRRQRDWYRGDIEKCLTDRTPALRQRYAQRYRNSVNLRPQAVD